jgi:hypothetical protein
LQSIILMCSLPLSTDYELLWRLVVADAEKIRKECRVY